jgi:hypothetical protein
MGIRVVPVQAISRVGSTTSRVEVNELGPAFQRNTVPGWTGSSTLTDLTSGFQAAHWSMAAMTVNTVSGSASIHSSSSAVAGALRLGLPECGYRKAAGHVERGTASTRGEGADGWWNSQAAAATPADPRMTDRPSTRG